MQDIFLFSEEYKCPKVTNVTKLVKDDILIDELVNFDLRCNFLQFNQVKINYI